MKSGFYIPNSISTDYVSTKRNAGGNYVYDQAVSEIGLNQQAAFSTINKEYNATINKAYSSYMMASRATKAAAMGQGYKEAYELANQENLIQQLAEANKSAASARYQVATNGLESLGNISEQFTQEVANMDRVAHSANSYLEYLKTLTGRDDASQSYLTEEQKGMSVDAMYDVLFKAQPQAYLDAEGNIGMSYIQWVNANLKDTEADKAWSQWLFGQGGYTQFLDAVKKGVKPL